MATLAILLDLHSTDGFGCLLLNLQEVLVSEIEVLDTLLRVLGVDPRYGEQVHDLLRETNARTRVSRKVNARKTLVAGVLRAQVEELVLIRAERTNLERDVVGDYDGPTTVWVLRGPECENPSNHADGVVTWGSVDLLKLVVLVEDKLTRLEDLLRQCQTRVERACFQPYVAERLREEVGEVVDVSSANEMSQLPLGLQ